MRVITRRKLKEFYSIHADAKSQLESWFREAKIARWKTPADVAAQFPRADFISGNRVVFDIVGNSYRLIVKIHYNTGLVFIRFVGTHAAYDRINAAAI